MRTTSAVRSSLNEHAAWWPLQVPPLGHGQIQKEDTQQVDEAARVSGTASRNPRVRFFISPDRSATRSVTDGSQSRFSLLIFMTKSTEAGGKTPQETASVPPEAPPAQKQGKPPMWTRTINRVEASVWMHEQPAGPRYVTSISRSYKHNTTGEWKRDHFYDTRDLADVMLAVREASEYIRNMELITEEANKS
jgi:hypothetical protein